MNGLGLTKLSLKGLESNIERTGLVSVFLWYVYLIGGLYEEFCS